MVAKPIDPEQLYKSILYWVEQKRGVQMSKAKPVLASDNVLEVNEDVVEVLPVIEGINVEEGVRRFANRWDFFRRLLQRFYVDHLTFIEDSKQTKEEDVEKAERLLHSFKGISGTISAPDLYEIAIKTEGDFKNSNPEFSESFIKMGIELNKILKVRNNFV